MKNRSHKALLVALPLIIVSIAPRLGALSSEATAGESSLQVAGLRAPVVVRRDERGIPHIEASNEEDLYLAQGYVTASDRLWQMDLARRTARGELAEIFGRNALDSDTHFRELGFGSLADELLRKCSPALRAAAEAYARGVNAFIKSRDQKSLPPEFQLLQYQPRPWQAADTIAVGKVFSMTLSNTWQQDLVRAEIARLTKEKQEMLLPEVSPLDVILVGSDKSPRGVAGHSPNRIARPLTAPLQVLEAASRVGDAVRQSLLQIGLWSEDRAASNNWVVSGKRTYSGKPLLANDPHLPASAPSIWYITHLSAPGLHVAGVTSPGVPGIIIGHNEHIAWGVTNFAPDVQDLYVETFDPANPRRYKTPGGWQEAQVRREEIKVRKNFGSAETETVVHEVKITRHGPIILSESDKHYALRWTALEPTARQFDTFLRINKARNWTEFREALRDFTEPSQNFVYADVNGHIGYYVPGAIPIRKSGDGTVPYDGSTDAGEWTGYVPFDKLPNVYDPPSGIIVTANNRTVGRDYPFLMTREWAVPYRARRIFELLQKKNKLTADDFRAIHGDVYSIGGTNFVREFIKLLKPIAKPETDAKLIETLRIFEAWDGRVNAEAREPVLVFEMRNGFRRRLLEKALGQELAGQYRWANADTFVDKVITERPKEWLPAGFSNYADLLKAVHDEARATITKRQGPDDSKWHWGHPQLAQVRIQHPLAGAPLIGQRFQITPFPQNGSAGALVTVNVGAAVSMRFIADTSDWNASRIGIILGQSGDPSSPHWKDQLDDWRTANPRTLAFSKAQVAGATKSTTTLLP
jgi:penicillin amidase